MNRMREAIKQAALAPAQLSAGSGEQSFCFDESFLGFAGHFPGYPILPAILQTLLAQIVAEQVLGCSLQFQALKRAKFSRQLRPGETIDVSLSCLEKEGQMRCAAKLQVEDEIAATFTMIFDKGTAVL